MCDDFPWTMIGGDIPVEVLAAIVEDGTTWATIGNINSDMNLWENKNRLAQALNEGEE